MAKDRTISSKLAEEIKKNNIELAIELTKRKQKITELNNKLQESRINLLETERRLKAANAKNYDFATDMKSLKQLNQKLQIELNKRDEKISEINRLIISTFSQAIGKYGTVMQAMGIKPSAANKSSSTNATPSKDDDETDISNGTIEYDTDDDDDVEIEASPSPQIIVIKSDEEEFSDDSNPEISSIHELLHETFLKSVSVQNGYDGNDDADDDLRDEVVCKKEADTIPSLIVTECNDTHNTPINVPKRTSSNGFLQVPKLSFGNRKSSPKTAFNSKSSPKIDQRHSLTPNSEPRSTSLSKIVEISPVSKPPHNQSNDAAHVDQQTSLVLSSLVNNNRSKNPLKTPNSSRHLTPYSTNKKPVLSNSTTENHRPKRIFSSASNITNRKNHVLFNSPTSPTMAHSIVNQLNGMDSDKTPLKNAKKTVAGPEDCIARHRTTRRAAPTDLRDPILLLKKRRKF